MKLMFISDIHGISDNLNTIRKKFKELNCDKLVILGDYYYNYSSHPSDIDSVKKLLEDFKDKLICVRGNSDHLADFDNIPVANIKDLDIIKTVNNDIYITHGHIYNDSNWDKTNSILIFGHLHRPFIKKIESNYYINPGSISIPRGGNPATFLIYDEEKFTIYDTSSNIIDEVSL